MDARKLFLRSALRVPLIMMMTLAVLEAAPVEEIAAYSVFKSSELSLSELLSGEVLTRRGMAMDFPRGISVQICFVVPGRVETVASAVCEWNPLQHPSIGVLAHASSRDPQSDFFDTFRFDPSKGPFKKLLSKTRDSVNGRSALYLTVTDQEALKTVKEGEAVVWERWWKGRLRSKLDSFRQNGISGQSPYRSDSQEGIRVEKEIRSLFLQFPGIQQRFGSLLESAQGADEGRIRNHYWQILNAQGTAAVVLGVMERQKFSESRSQVVDFQWFANDAFYVSLTLYEFFQITVDQKDAVLIWRGDFISAPSFEMLKGVDRMASSIVMLQEIKKANAFLIRDLKGK